MRPKVSVTCGQIKLTAGVLNFDSKLLSAQ